MLKINLFFFDITEISGPIKSYLESDLIKKIRTIEINNSEHFINDRLIEYFFTPLIHKIESNLINDDHLITIGNTCTSLKELDIIQALFTQRGFHKFLKTNQCKHLKKLTANLNYLYPENIHQYLPSLEEMNLDYFCDLQDEINTKNFLIASQDLKSIEFSSSWDYNYIIPEFQKFKHLESLSFSYNYISLSQFILLMNVLNQHVIKSISLNISEFSFEMIAPFFKHLSHLQEIIIGFHVHEDFNRIMIEIQMMRFLDIISSLDIKNRHLTKLNLIANINNNEIRIPNHRQRMLQLLDKFPNLKSVQLGWGIFYFP